MTGALGQVFIHLDPLVAVQIAFLGFVGGILSGFIGSGGAFFMTPGMMNLGVPGPVAVASNITHKFGKALVGSRKHGELGNVDRKLAYFMLATAAVGIRLAVWVMKRIFGAGGIHGAGADLYISAVFVGVLSVVAVLMLRDIVRSRKADISGPSTAIVDLLGRLRLHPLIHFPVADVRVSLWVILVCGLATGYLAGTIGVGGFIGVPAMIYVFGVPAAVAAGSELYLAVFMGAFGAINYAYEGVVDIRLTLLLYAGSLIGVQLGTYGTKVVKELYIRLTTAAIILLCVISRLVAVPVYLRQLGYLDISKAYDEYFNAGSKGLLYASGLLGGALIMGFVLRAYVRQRRLQARLVAAVAGEADARGAT